MSNNAFNKVNLRSELMYSIYKQVTKELEDILTNIIIKNSVINKYDHRSFIYKNELYTLDLQIPPPLRKNRLSITLKEEMDNYLLVRSKIVEEMSYVSGYIIRILNLTNNPYYYFKLFPDILHPALKVLIPQPIVELPLPNNFISLKEQDDKAIQLIKQRLLLNLIS